MTGLILLLATGLQAPAPADTAGAYLDARARQLVAGARGRRTLVDASITRYQAVAKERISMGLRTRLRDRLFYRREVATRIDWQPGGPIRVEVLGAREVVPVATGKPSIPEDLKGFVPHLAFDPMDPGALLRIDTTSMRHPLAAGGEAYYRFRSGATTTIQLADRAIRLYELEVLPRRPDFRLVSGSFWIDSATHSVVRVVFRPSKVFDLEEDADPDDRAEARKIPAFFRPVRAELEYITIDYGLVNLRWWMPRLLAAQGVIQMGAIRAPLSYERSYGDYVVYGDTAAALVVVSDSAQLQRSCRPGAELSVNVNLGDEKPSAKDAERIAVRARADSTRLAADTARARRRRQARECLSRYTVSVPDSSQLLSAQELSPSIYGPGEILTTESELNELADQLKNIAEVPWQVRPPTLNWGLGGAGLVRYNKVEALSVGARGEFDLTRLRLDASARIGVADLTPGYEIGIARATPSRTLRFAGYRRLDVMQRDAGSGGLMSSLEALLLGNDDRDYFRTNGVELRMRPAEAARQWYDVRLFAERQRPAYTNTSISARHVFSNAHNFGRNRRADRADQMGAALFLRGTRGQDPLGWRASAEAGVEAETGSYDFTRESVLMQVGFPLPLRLVGAFEGAAGVTTGSVPLQSLWYLGGAPSMRGYAIGTASGTTFWRGRGEIATALPAFRLALFSDFGWARDRTDVPQTESRLLSVGAGVSALDGLVRLDIARALRGDRGWRLHARMDAAL
jgi:hypothetical protein